MMTHTLTDDRQGDVLGFGCTGPGVPSYIQRQRQRKLDELTYEFQLAVDVAQPLFILFVLVLAGGLKDGQQVRTGNGIAVQDVLHAGFPPHGKELAGFAATIGKDAVLQVALFEVGHVDEGHAPGVEREEEEVAGQGELGVVTEVELLDAVHGLEGYSPLGGFVDAGIDFAEGMVLWGISLSYGSVIGGSENAVIKGYGVFYNAAVVQVGFILLHQIGGDFMEEQVALLTEAPEAVEGTLIVFGSTVLAHLFQPGNVAMHEAE